MNAHINRFVRPAMIAGACASSAIIAAGVAIGCEADERSADASARGARATVSVIPAKSDIPPLLEHAYRAYQTGDLDAAKAAYLGQLAIEPLNRDALLGAAAIAVREGDPARAYALYLKLIEIDPRDAVAQAALASLQVPAAATESRLKRRLDARPEGAHLHFALGNQYAAQSRWHDARAAYLRAYAAEPDQPDFAYNLAVSYDRLRQSALALEYYRRALKLAAVHRPSFDADAVGARVLRLEPESVAGRAQ